VVTVSQFPFSSPFPSLSVLSARCRPTVAQCPISSTFVSYRINWQWLFNIGQRVCFVPFWSGPFLFFVGTSKRFSYPSRHHPTWSFVTFTLSGTICFYRHTVSVIFTFSMPCLVVNQQFQSAKEWSIEVLYNVGWIQSTCLKHFLSWQNLSVMTNHRAFYNSFPRTTMIRFELVIIDCWQLC